MSSEPGPREKPASLGLRSGGEPLRSGAMKLFSLLLLAVALMGVSCERHEFDGPEGTKRLHKSHGAHEDKDHAEDSAGH